jgi:hypothetical protein
MKSEGNTPSDFKITTELLYKGALLFALLDAVYVPILVWRVNRDAFRRMKWPLVISAGLVWYAIWAWAIGNFWATVYSYVFPAWTQTVLPWIAFVVAGVAALLLWMLTIRSKRNAILTFCLTGGALGSLTHIWAIYQGIVTKPPMLQGASPLAAVVIAFFEYMFYWCTILVLARIMDWMQGMLKGKQLQIPD